MQQQERWIQEYQKWWEEFQEYQKSFKIAAPHTRPPKRSREEQEEEIEEEIQEEESQETLHLEDDAAGGEGSRRWITEALALERDNDELRSEVTKLRAR